MDEKAEYYDDDDDEVWLEYSALYGVTFPERDITKCIYLYVPPFLLFIGTLGNIMSAIILHKIYSKVLSSCLYLFVIVIVDLLVLYILCGNVWLEHLAEIDVRRVAMVHNNSLCKIYPFISDFVLHLTTWMLVAMAIETTAVTMQPPRLIRMCNVERARAVILLIIVLLVCFNAHCFWSYSLVKIDKSTLKTEICTKVKSGNQKGEEFRKIVWPILNILIADLLPYCIIFSCSVILITKRMKRKDQMRELETIWKTFTIESDSGKQFHTSILAICVSYVILLLAKLGNGVFSFLVDPELELVENSLVMEAKKMLADAVSFTLLYVFLSCKFFILLGSARFRHELVVLLTCQGCCRRRVDTGVSRPPTKSSQQPLLLPVNNHTSPAVPASSEHVEHHHHHQHHQHHQHQHHGVLQVSPPHPPPPQQSIVHQDHHTAILCLEPAAYVDSSGGGNNLSPRKQIYSMTSV